MFSTQTRQKIEAELETAQRARESGNEGRARVCARRAAGFAIANYFTGQGIASPGSNAIDLLTSLQSAPALSDDIKKAAGLLLLRVTPEYQFPVPVDLLAETRRLIHALDDLTHPTD